MDDTGTDKKGNQGRQTQKEKDKALAKRVRACAAEGSWRRGIAAIKNADSKPRSAPKDWTHILAELSEKDNIQEGMRNPGPIILDSEEKAALREAIKTASRTET